MGTERDSSCSNSIKAVGEINALSVTAGHGAGKRGKVYEREECQEPV